MLYLRFEGAAEAIRHAIEQLSAESLRGSVLEVGDERYDAGLIQKLYASDDTRWRGHIRSSEYRPACGSIGASLEATHGDKQTLDAPLH